MSDIDIRDSPELEPGPSDSESVVPADPEPAKPEPPVATCPYDGDPLVMTFAFSGYEFICLRCGRLYGFLEPRAVPATPELEAKIIERRAEFEPFAKAILTPGSYHDGCELCVAGEQHLDHATADEVAASDAALAKVQEIRRRVRERSE